MSLHLVASDFTPETETTALTVLVTSSRTWSDGPYIWRVLDAVRGMLDSMTLRHGACREGGDLHADQWYRTRKREGDDGLFVDRCPAKWSHGGGAGFTRNREMVDKGVDLVLAFARLCENPRCKRPDPHVTHGTEQCATYAEGSGVEVRWLRWEDR